MEYVSLALNILFAVFLVVGFLFGLKRGMKRTLVRSVWILLITILLVLVSTNITAGLLKLKVFSFSHNGQDCSSLYEFLLVVFKDILPVEGANYEGLVDIGMFLITILLSGVIFLVLYWVAKLITLPLYWIVNAFIFAKEKKQKKLARKEKKKIKIKKHRLVGGLIGVLVAFLSFCMTMVPIMGYINVINIVDRETSNDEGKGVLSQNVDEYSQIMGYYNKSIPMTVMNSIGLDNVAYAIFDGLTSSKINGTKIVLSDETVSLARIYKELEKVEVPNFDTITQPELNVTLESVESLVNVVFESKLISASSDVVIPILAKYARQTINTDEFKPYALQFYNVLFDEIEKLNSAGAKQEIINIIALVKTLNANDLLLPIIQDPNGLSINHLKTHLTKDVSDKIIADLFAINTVNNVAPALVNFLLGYGAEKLDYEYSSENVVTSEALKQGAEIMMYSAVDLLQHYDENNSTKVELNTTTAAALGGMLDEIRNILSPENFESVANALEPELDKVAKDALSSQPEFMKSSASEAISNISEISNYKNAFLSVYNAYDTIIGEFDGAKIDGNYDVQYMDFVKIGAAMDDIQNSGLFKDNLMLRTMSSAVEYYSDKFEKEISTPEKPFTFTLDSKIISNIDELKNIGVVWKNEFPKYKNTFGIFLNLFQNDGNVIDKIKSDSDTSLQELGYELDHDLKNSALLKGADRLLVADMINIADIKVNSSNDEDLTILLSDARNNVLNEHIDVVWECEFVHIKELIKLEFSDSSDDNLTVIASSIDKVVFGHSLSGKEWPGSVIFTQDIINKYISNYMDKVFTDVDEESDFYTTIQQIKISFNTETITSYEKEITALLKLKEVKTLVEDDGFDFKTGTPAGAVQLGQKIDQSLEIGGVIVDKPLVNDFITKKIDKYFDDYKSDMETEIQSIKDGFNDDIVKYEAEFSALLNLMKISDKTNENSFDFEIKEHAVALGATVDTALAKTTIGGVDYSSTIVTNDLINGYIKRYLSDVSNVNISADSDFGNVIETITGKKTGDTFDTGRIDTMVNYDAVDGVTGNIYQKEFGYLSQLIVVTHNFSDVALENIDKTNTALNSTLADQFDGNSEENERIKVLDPLRNSYLVGDSLLVAIDGALSTYTTQNSTTYGDILSEINSNYSVANGIRDNVIWMGKRNGVITYTNLIDAFAELDETLTTSSIVADIDEPTDLSLDIAREYDETLARLQGTRTSNGNILFLTNGTNRLAKFALEKVKKVLDGNSAYESVVNYINTYMDFLDGYFAVNQDAKRNVKYYYLSYADVSEMTYVKLVDGAEEIWQATDVFVDGENIQINTPFQFISSKINP